MKTLRQISKLLTAFLFFSSGCAIAAQDKEWSRPAQVIGYGYKSCGDFIQAAKLERPFIGRSDEKGTWISGSSMFIEWAYGFVSATNLQRATDESLPAPIVWQANNMITWLEEHCKKNPDEIFMNAVSTMVKARTAP